MRRHLEMIEIHRQALLQRMRGVLAEGKILVVLGWRDSNHDHQTRQTSREGRVMFYHQVPSSLGSKVGLVISNQFINHSDFNRIKARMEIHPVVLPNGEIKRLLKDCADLLRPAALPLSITTVVLNNVVEKPQSPIAPTIIESLTALLNQGQRKDKEMVMTQQPIDKFIKLFRAEAEKNGEGLVSKNVVGELRRKAGITASNSAMVAEGWLEPVISEGSTHAGQYRATKKLLEHTGEEPPIESADPVVRARRLIAEKSKVEEQITLEKVTLLELEEKLKKIQSAEELLGQLEKLMKLTT